MAPRGFLSLSEICLLERVAHRRPGHHVLGAEVGELHALQQEVGQTLKGKEIVQ